MTAPDLDDLENVIGSLEGAIDNLALVAESMDHVHTGDPTYWLIGKLRQDTARLGEWFEKAHEAARSTGLRAVT